jgi:hypothetical protein
MGPRSAGFDELESGYPAITDNDEPREPEFAAEEDEEGEANVSASDAEEDELAMAEQDYLREIHSGMLVSEEEDHAI